MILVKKFRLCNVNDRNVPFEKFYVKDEAKIKFWKGMARTYPDRIRVEKIK